MTHNPLRTIYARSDRIVGRRIGPEFVLVPLVGHGAELEAIYNLGGAGVFIWERIDGRTDGDSIVDEMIAAFDVRRPEAAEDYATFTRHLVEIGALKVVSAPIRRK
jgi:hypothetical protein